MCRVGWVEIEKEINKWLIDTQQNEIMTIVESYREGYCSRTELLWVFAKMMESAYQAGYSMQQIEGCQNG